MADNEERYYKITNSGLFLTAYRNPTVTTRPSSWFLVRWVQEHFSSPPGSPDPEDFPEPFTSPPGSPPVYRIKANQPASAPGQIILPAVVSLDPVFEPRAQPKKGSVLTTFAGSDAGWSITPDALDRGSIVTVSKFPEGVKFPDGISVYLVQEEGKVGWVAADNTVVGQVPEGAVWNFQKLDREFPRRARALKITNSGFLTGFNDGHDVTISVTDKGATWGVASLNPTKDPKEHSYNFYAIDPPNEIGAWPFLSLAPVFEPTLEGAQPEKGSVRTVTEEFGWSITATDELCKSFIITASTFPEGVNFPDGVSVYLVQQAGKVGWVAADNTAVGQVPEGAVWTFDSVDE